MFLPRPFRIRRLSVFRKWFDDLRDEATKAIITRRITRVAEGNPGNTRSVGEGVFELKIDFGPGYRVYYVRRGEAILLLLCGGDKSTQAKDILRAKELAATHGEAENDR